MLILKCKLAFLAFFFLVNLPISATAQALPEQLIIDNMLGIEEPECTSWSYDSDLNYSTT